MLSKTTVRRLVAAGFVLGVLAAATPGASLAANGGGNPQPSGQSR